MSRILGQFHPYRLGVERSGAQGPPSCAHGIGAGGRSLADFSRFLQGYAEFGCPAGPEKRGGNNLGMPALSCAYALAPVEKGWNGQVVIGLEATGLW
jgi:hypothetical protein